MRIRGLGTVCLVVLYKNLSMQPLVFVYFLSNAGSMENPTKAFLPRPNNGRRLVTHLPWRLLHFESGVWG